MVSGYQNKQSKPFSDDSMEKYCLTFGNFPKMTISAQYVGVKFSGGSSIFHLSPPQKVNLVTKLVNFQKISPAAPTFYLYHSVLKINIEITAIKRPFSYLKNLARKFVDMLGGLSLIHI